MRMQLNYYEIRETGALPDADKFDSAITEFKKF